MEGEEKVFSSKIIRINKKLKNNLHDLINIQPAKPVTENTHKYETCDFVPRTDKYYVPKKKNGAKVRTVRDIRNTFEKDVFSYLPEDLEKQKDLLMRRIRTGSLKEEQTKNIARNILKSDAPVTRQVWQMVTNINPLDCKYTSQYVLWNGRHIRVNGSRGGESKFIYNYDNHKAKKTSFNKQINKRPFIPKRRGLLHNSLSVKFKPGPLTRKSFLDTSNQRYQFGDMDLINLPKVGLEVQPTIGKAVAPSISTFIQNTFLCGGDETITKTWADFSVSVLGTVKNGAPAQTNEDCITFDINYKCQQNRLLMRHDSDKTNILCDVVSTTVGQRTEKKSTLLSEVKNVIQDILDSVEISLNQDNMYSGEDDLRVCSNEPETNITMQSKSNNSKNKPKRKCNELNRLDVTVITIPKTFEPNQSDNCLNAFCTFGCVCESIKCSFNLKRHCGRLECMFHCKCDFSKYNTMDSIDNDCSDILPGLVNLDKKLALNLAKEEQKFHQTVIFTDDKSIHLKSTKRNWKTSKKSVESFSKMRLKAEIDGSRMLSIKCINLDCKDVEPWCMVHNLYKCFCKGKFLETSYNSKEDVKACNNEHEITTPTISIDTSKSTNCDDKVVDKDLEIETNDLLIERRNNKTRGFGNKPSDFGNIPSGLGNKPSGFGNKPSGFGNKPSGFGNNPSGFGNKPSGFGNKPSGFGNKPSGFGNKPSGFGNKPSRFGNKSSGLINIFEPAPITEDNSVLDVSSHRKYSCARVTSYAGRKYDDCHYRRGNQKIFDMEKNDKKLQSRLMAILSQYNKTKPSPAQNDKSKVSNQSLSPSELNINSTPDVVIIPENNTNSTSSLDELLSNVIKDTVKEPSEEISKPREKRLLNKSKLVAWLESSYKQYKLTPQENLVKLSLESPKNGKVALYSWEFILSRYQEKKNYFLLTKQKPFRIFMAVDIKNPFFENCMNISNIPLSEINDYPITVRNLLTNARNLTDNFCILHGLSFCWELVGSVAKVKDKPANKIENDNKDETNGTTSFVSVNKGSEFQNNSGFTTDLDNIPIVDIDDSDSESNQSSNTHSESHGEDFKNPQQEDNTELSKWFLMTIVNDFTEIRFYNKGFFVKYESVIKAINVARISGKTVRLSSQRCNTAQSDPQFGIYAIPSQEKYCVFIGPYENNERLGIETVKNTVTKKMKDSTRGIWITTNKVDNINVVDNPLLYLPSHNLELDNMVTLECDTGAVNTPSDLGNASDVQMNSEIVKNKTPLKKVIKPIKIKKGGFYQLTPNNILKKSDQPSKQVKSNVKPIVLNKSLIISPNKTLTCLLSRSPITTKTEEFKIFTEKIKELNKSPESKPVAEIAPQIKETKNNIPESRKRKREGGMYVLKPEEINLKCWDKPELFDQPQSSGQDHDAKDVDVEKCTSKSEVRTNNDIYIISDDEEEKKSSELIKSSKNIWIICKNIENIGWIPGRKDHRNNLSFEIPGFKFSNYYPIQEAYEKINQVLSKKVEVPMYMNLEWSYVESEAEVKGRSRLSSDDLHSDFVLTRKGLYHRYHFMNGFDNLNDLQGSTSLEECFVDDEFANKKLRLSSETEETNSTLEGENSLLLNKMINKVELKEAFTNGNVELLNDINDKLVTIITETQEKS